MLLWPPPAGGGVADKGAENELALARLAPVTRAALADLLPPFASVQNPVNLTSAIMVNLALLLECSRILVRDPEVDTLIVRHGFTELICSPAGPKAADAPIVFRKNSFPEFACFFTLRASKKRVDRTKKPVYYFFIRLDAKVLIFDLFHRPDRAKNSNLAERMRF